MRDSVPLLIGLMGPSGGGKTYSALRLATGIQAVTGGDIFGIDTEARRMLHYADRFSFKHVSFAAPFGSLDYLEALQFCVGQGGKVIIVDSMSHEHAGAGGMLDAHEQELDRLAGNDFGKRDRVKMLAWQRPKADRRALINGLLQLEANFIFCFRSKETAKPVKVNGKTEVQQQGFMPIAGDEFVFEQTVNCLLLPAAGGVPTWRSDQVGERLMMKLPEQFRELFAELSSLSEQHGRSLAAWARGGQMKPPHDSETGEVLDAVADEPIGKTTDEFDADLAMAAKGGTAALQAAWAALPAEVKPTLKVALDRRHKPAAAQADAAGAGGAAA